MYTKKDELFLWKVKRSILPCSVYWQTYTIPTDGNISSSCLDTPLPFLYKKDRRKEIITLIIKGAFSY